VAQPWPRIGLAVVDAGCALAYGWLAAETRPFTVGADVVTAVPLGLFAAASGRRLAVRRASGAGEAAPCHPPSVREEGFGRFGRFGRFGPWTAVLSVATIWELATYLAGFGAGRPDFPTLSSLYDMAARSHPAKALLFASWLALGWGLVRP
jgi:hypothetical protein